MVVEFFNLQQTGLEQQQALAWLAAKYLPQRVLMWTQNREQAAALDQWLWAYDAASFLPHGLSDEASASAEPVLLSPELKNLNQAKVLILAHTPAAGWLPPAGGFARTVELIPAGPGPELEICRNRYRLLSKKFKLEHTVSLS